MGHIDRANIETYKVWAQKLIDSGRAYADPYTSEEVQAFREAAQKAKTILYRNHRLKPTGVGRQSRSFKADPKSYTRLDAVMGELTTGPEVIDDFIIIKSDGFPTYNFAHIVDDAEMEVTHIIRGQEFFRHFQTTLICTKLALTPSYGHNAAYNGARRQEEAQ